MITWKMNGEVMDRRENDLNRLYSFVEKAGLVIELEADDYLLFYDNYGNMHEYIKDNQ